MFDRNESRGKDPGLDIIAALQQSVAPWMWAGQGALPDLQNKYGQMMNDPGALYDKLASGYQHSPGYDRKMYEGTQAAQNAAAAGGMSGSPMHQQWASQISEDIAGKDFNDYMDRMMGMFGTGLSGEQGLAKWGFEGSQHMGDSIASYLAQREMMDFMKKQAEKSGNADMWKSIFGAAGQVGGAYAGSYGGPAGSMAGAKGGQMAGSAIGDQLSKFFGG